MLSLLVLGVATLITALVAEILVGSLEVFADAGAERVLRGSRHRRDRRQRRRARRRGRDRASREHQAGSRVALASGAQVALFLIPAVAIISWAIDPLSLAFRPVEIAAVAGAAMLTAVLLRDGRSASWKGIVLIVAYGLVALAFLLVGDRSF